MGAPLAFGRLGRQLRRDMVATRQPRSQPAPRSAHTRVHAYVAKHARTGSAHVVRGYRAGACVPKQGIVSSAYARVDDIQRTASACPHTGRRRRGHRSRQTCRWSAPGIAPPTRSATRRGVRRVACGVRCAACGVRRRRGVHVARIVRRALASRKGVGTRREVRGARSRPPPSWHGTSKWSGSRRCCPHRSGRWACRTTQRRPAWSIGTSGR